MNAHKTKDTEEAVKNIKGFIKDLDKLIPKYKETVKHFENTLKPKAELQSCEYWRAVAYTDSLVKLRIIIEENFYYIETMSILAVTRYIFELSIWLKRLFDDEIYGLIYYRQLLAQQRRYYDDLKNHLEKEVAFYQLVGEKESELTREKIKQAGKIKGEDERNKAYRSVANDTFREIDNEAASKFTIFFKDAQTNGYDYQAHLIENNLMTDVNIGVNDIKNNIDEFDNKLQEDEKKLITKKWYWNNEARLAGMSDEYEFIYSYTSRLLHATPASLTTKYKNLKPDEVLMFLRYISSRIQRTVNEAEILLSKNKVVH